MQILYILGTLEYRILQKRIQVVKWRNPLKYCLSFKKLQWGGGGVMIEQFRAECN